MEDIEVRRVTFGHFIRPAEETGTGAPRPEPTLGYLIRHPAGDLLVDTGMGSDPWVDDHYRPARVPLQDALTRAGSDVDAIRYVVNCHLHFDHCGGNPDLPNRPIFTQRTELAAAHTTDYTIPSLVDFRGARYEPLDGEAEILPNVLLIPTPGHTAGHQSVAVRRPDGTVIVAGQSHDTATDFSTAALSHQTGLTSQPAWLPRLLDLDPRRILFAHDNAVWTP